MQPSLWLYLVCPPWHSEVLASLPPCSATFPRLLSSVQQILPMRGTSVLSLIALSTVVSAGVSTYRLPVPRPTPGYTYEGWEAYDPTQPIVPPPHPDPMPNLDFSVTLDYNGNPKAGIPVPGSFLGISIEMSLAEAVIGPNATWIWPQFLNIMSILKARGGSPVLRLGGNSQEKAKLVAELPRGHSIERHAIGPTSFTNTPTVLVSTAASLSPSVIHTDPFTSSQKASSRL